MLAPADCKQAEKIWRSCMQIVCGGRRGRLRVRIWLQGCWMRKFLLSKKLSEWMSKIEVEVDQNCHLLTS
jgi:hypothetical protein